MSELVNKASLSPSPVWRRSPCFFRSFIHEAAVLRSAAFLLMPKRKEVAMPTP